MLSWARQYIEIFILKMKVNLQKSLRTFAFDKMQIFEDFFVLTKIVKFFLYIKNCLSYLFFISIQNIFKKSKQDSPKKLFS